MSTKIYYGCRVSRDVDLMDLADRIRTTLLPLRYQLEATEISKRIASIIDQESMSMIRTEPKMGRRSPFATAGYAWREEQKEYGPHHTDHDPFRFTMQIIGANNHYYLLPFFGQDEYFDVLLSVDGVEHYPYYNNAEEPEGITRKQWKARGEEWDAVPGIGEGVPADHGLSFDLAVRNDPLWVFNDRRELLVEHQPSIERRSFAVLQDVIATMRPYRGEGYSGIMSHFARIGEAAKIASATPGVMEGIVPLTEKMLAGEDQHPDVRVNLDLIRKILDDCDERNPDEDD